MPNEKAVRVRSADGRESIRTVPLQQAVPRERKKIRTLKGVSKQMKLNRGKIILDSPLDSIEEEKSKVVFSKSAE